MPSPERDCAAPAPERARKAVSAILVIAFAIGICWVVEKRSAPPPPPHVSPPYAQAPPPAAK